MRAILIGEYEGSFPDFEIIERRSITWPDDVDECYEKFCDLVDSADKMCASIILQDIPVQLIAVISGKNIIYKRGIYLQVANDRFVPYTHVYGMVLRREKFELINIM